MCCKASNLNNYLLIKCGIQKTNYSFINAKKAEFFLFFFFFFSVCHWRGKKEDSRTENFDKGGNLNQGCRKCPNARTRFGGNFDQQFNN